MKQMNKTQQWIVSISLMALCVILSIRPATVCAIEPIDLSRDDLSLKIRYVHEDVPLAGAAFALYRIADLDEFANPTPMDSFADFSGKITDAGENGEWNDLAQELADYLTGHDDILPINHGVTDSDGMYTISQLTPGLYLVIGHPVRIDGTNYTCNPFLINLPNRESDADDWKYQETASPKPGAVHQEIIPQRPTPPQGDKLPQTGMLWWPVPVLVSMGLFCFLEGLLQKKDRTNEK
ncbi:MAG: hypothetical protein KBS74_03045 [Clostridiales bacterium]|nr:hypothetical protein [Candidatus Cacconaster stercorequi]